MTQTSYGEYGTRQDEFGYLSPESQAEVISYCHTVALMMNEARGAVYQAAGLQMATCDDCRVNTDSIMLVSLVIGKVAIEALTCHGCAPGYCARAVDTLGVLATTYPGGEVEVIKDDTHLVKIMPLSSAMLLQRDGLWYVVA